MARLQGLRRALLRLRFLRRQDGIALIISMGVLSMLTITGTTVMVYTTSNTKTSELSRSNERSFSLSEAALNDAMAVLANPDNDALKQATLPSTEATASSIQYEGGTAKWWGVLDSSTNVWTVSAVGLYDDPTGPGLPQVRRLLTAIVPVVP